MYMTKRQDEDQLTVRLTLHKEMLQPKVKRPLGPGPATASGATAPASASQGQPQEREPTISIVPVFYSNIMPPGSRQLNKESSVNSTKMLLRRHAHVPKRNLNAHEFFKAIYQGQLSNILYFLRVVSIRSVDPADGKTPLMAALHIGAEKRRQEVFNYLAHHGAVYDGVDDQYRRDLVGWATALGRHEELRDILRDTTEEVNLQYRDALGLTYMHLAVMSGSLPTVEIIIDEFRRLDVSVDMPDAEGITPYLLSRKLGYTRISQCLQQRGRASAHKSDPVSLRSPREWSVIGRQERLMAKQQLLRYTNRAVLPLTEEESPIEALPVPPVTERGETYAEIRMQLLAPPTSKTSQQLVHDVFDLWSEQHRPSYQRGAARARWLDQDVGKNDACGRGGGAGGRFGKKNATGKRSRLANK
ncbi:hypothetical protein BOX15_Mlig014263g1 [Macrostomum lignano]|uniref:Uncharacterized protein n=1 Tax=Macrostomum lignano TaxID=282301 RepID=A0A267H7D6_9PLAT|nr:hypothetical protein BOX15_Mlig014263g1 [Macrostomum lignano]